MNDEHTTRERERLTTAELGIEADKLRLAATEMEFAPEALSDFEARRAEHHIEQAVIAGLDYRAKLRETHPQAFTETAVSRSIPRELTSAGIIELATQLNETSRAIAAMESDPSFGPDAS